MSGYRSLKQGEKVRMWYKSSDRGYDAIKVCSPTGGDCNGCEKKVKPFKKLNRYGPIAGIISGIVLNVLRRNQTGSGGGRKG